MSEDAEMVRAAEFDPSEPGYAKGQVEYDARRAIRDLIAMAGFESAREKIAFYLIDEAGPEAMKWQR